MQKLFPEHVPPPLQWPERIKISACPAPMQSSALDNQEPGVIAVANSTKVGWCESPGLRGAEAAEGFLVACDLAALEYAFPVGESEIAVVSLDISRAS